MSTAGSIKADQNSSVALIITHTVKTGEEIRYEAWLMEILSAVSSFPGYLGREIFRPPQGTGTYTSIVRFDANDHLNAWVESETRNSFVSRASHLLEKGDVHEIRTGS